VDDVTEPLLDQLTPENRNVVLSELVNLNSSILREVRIATHRVARVCTDLLDFHLSLGWTWESATVLRFSCISSGSGISAGTSLIMRYLSLSIQSMQSQLQLPTED
jgi:hypothetical protein